MLSPLQTPSELPHSSEQHIDFNDNRRVTATKPFSIRQFVCEARQKDICHNWPFSEDFLEVCTKHGISRVLPPFEPCDTVSKRFRREDVGLNYAAKEKSDHGFIDKHRMQTDGKQEDDKVRNDAHMDEALSEISKQVCLLSFTGNRSEHGEDNDLSSDTVFHPLVPKVHTSTTKLSLNHLADQSLGALPSTKRLRHKGKKHKGKPKKRLIVDIFAETRPCTLEDIDRVNEFNCGIDQSLKSENFVKERKESVITVKHGCKVKLVEGFWKAKHRRDEIVGNVNLLEKRRRLMKINLNESKSKLCNITMNPPRTVENDWDSIKGGSLVDERNKCIVKVEHDSKPKLEEGLCKAKHPGYGSAGSSNLLGNKKQILKIKLKGCKPKE